MSWLRLGLLKRALPTGLLATLDGVFQRTGWAISPSIFLDLAAESEDSDADFIKSQDPLDLLKCPQSGSALRRDGDALVSESGIRWGIPGGVYDFREPLS